MNRYADWAEMATAVMAYIDAYGGPGAYDVLHLIDGYSATTTGCADCDAPEPLAEPMPGLSAPQHAALVVLAARPRTREEVADLAGWNSGTAAGVLRSLERRGLAEHAAGLWSRL
jgi:hypothetical protein